MAVLTNFDCSPLHLSLIICPVRLTPQAHESFSERLYQVSTMLRHYVSILMPLYNEEELVATAIARVLQAPLPAGMACELIVVDDGSTDGSVEIVTSIAREHPGVIRLIRHSQNRGKGAAIRTAIQHAKGEFCLIQDADLEYNPAEYPKLLKPLVEDIADAVFGSRFSVAGERRVLFFWHAVANHVLTTISNMVSDLNLTDMETGYKAFRTAVVQTIPLRSNRFGIEPELTIKLAQRRLRIYEVPISYYGRTYEEGKKIGFKDAVQAVFVILKYWLHRDIYMDSGARILDTLAHAPRFNRWMADTIRPYMREEVLEIGAGIGNMTRHLLSRRKRYITTDIDEGHLTALRARYGEQCHVEVDSCDVTNPTDFEKFRELVDTVVCLNVVEHVEDDILALRNIYSALRKNGKAIILVPQGQSLYGTLDEVLGHCRRYSEEELRMKMEQAGFCVEHILHFNRMTRPGWYLNGRILKKTTFSRVQLFFFDRLVWLWRRVDDWLPWQPVSIVAIGSKHESC